MFWANIACSRGNYHPETCTNKVQNTRKEPLLCQGACNKTHNVHTLHNNQCLCSYCTQISDEGHLSPPHHSNLTLSLYSVDRHTLNNIHVSVMNIIVGTIVITHLIHQRSNYYPAVSYDSDLEMSHCGWAAT